MAGPATTTLPCAVCGAQLEQMDGQSDVPYAANIFTSSGHYGATAYDSPCGEHLELFICTPCLVGMRARSAVHRVLHRTADTPEQQNLWGSAEDSDRDNPLNRQRLRNESILCGFLDEAEGMDRDWSERLFAACNEASGKGQPFDPGTVPAP